MAAIDRAQSSASAAEQQALRDARSALSGAGAERGAIAGDGYDKAKRRRVLPQRLKPLWSQLGLHVRAEALRPHEQDTVQRTAALPWQRKFSGCWTARFGGKLGVVGWVPCAFAYKRKLVFVVALVVAGLLATGVGFAGAACGAPDRESREKHLQL